jgi:AraC-like DNA-binding protein
VLGFQLHPAAVPAVLGVPATAVRDERTPIAELWGTAGRDLVDALGSVVGPDQAATLIEHACSHRMRRAEFVPAMGDLRRLVRAGRDPDLRALGLSERQLRRNCCAAHGYGPQMLRRIVRFQAVLRLLGQGRVLPLADVAHRTGHVDQAHLAHEVGTFSGLTPAALRRLLVPASRATNVVPGE